MDGCGAPEQGAAVAEAGDQVVLAGKVTANNAAVSGAFVRLLDSSGEFTAEVVSSADGEFQFFAAPGAWTVRALHRSGSGESTVRAEGIGLHEADIVLA